MVWVFIRLIHSNYTFLLHSLRPASVYGEINIHFHVSNSLLGYNLIASKGWDINIHVSRVLTSIAPKRLALSPILSSMYLRSSSVIVGCFAGLSYDTKSQNMYQTMPKLPVEYVKEREGLKNKLSQQEGSKIVPVFFLHGILCSPP